LNPVFIYIIPHPYYISTIFLKPYVFIDIVDFRYDIFINFMNGLIFLSEFWEQTGNKEI